MKRRKGGRKKGGGKKGGGKKITYQVEKNKTKFYAVATVPTTGAGIFALQSDY